MCSLYYLLFSACSHCFSTQCFFFFFFTDPAPTEIYTLSLHDALPIWPPSRPRSARAGSVCSSSAASRSWTDRKSTRLNSSHTVISYAVFCLKKKRNWNTPITYCYTHLQDHCVAKAYSPVLTTEDLTGA